MTLENNRAPLLSNIKLCASFHHHMWIQTGVTVRIRLSWVLTSVTLTFDLWPWPFAWTSLLSMVNSWKFHDDPMMGTWWKRCNRRTDGRTDRQTEVLRAAWSQLKNKIDLIMTGLLYTYQLLEDHFWCPQKIHFWSPPQYLSSKSCHILRKLLWGKGSSVCKGLCWTWKCK